MHPWFTTFTSYVQKQLPHLSEANKYCLVLIQRYCDCHNVASISEACEILSKCQMITLTELDGRGELIKNDISPFTPSASSELCKEGEVPSIGNVSPTDYKNAMLILVAQFLVVVNGSSGTIYVQDSSGTLHFSLSSIQQFPLQPDHFSRPALFVKWNFIVSAIAGKFLGNHCQNKNSNEKQEDTLKYIEVQQALFQELQPCIHSNLKILHVSEFLAKYRKQKLNNITGILVAKSPVHKVSGHTPFFFIWLRCFSVDSNSSSLKIVAIVIQGPNFVHWHLFLRLHTRIEITDVKRSMLSKGSSNERKTFCISRTSKLNVTQQDTRIPCVKTNFGADLETYTGVITCEKRAEFGIYELDDNIKLLICYQSHLNQGRGFRCGAVIRATNVHKHQFKTNVVLCCCALSTVEVIEHSTSLSSPYQLFIPHNNALPSKCHDYSWEGYFWLVETTSKMMKNFLGRFPVRNVRSNIDKELCNFFPVKRKVVDKRKSVIEEFLDLPHACIVTAATTTLTTEAAADTFSSFPDYVSIEELRNYCLTRLDQQEWFSGMEFDFFTSLNYQQKRKWFYCSVDANKSKGSKVIISGVAIGDKNTFTLRDCTGSIHIISPYISQSLNRRLILIKNFQIIAERYTYVELHKASGQGEEKEFTKMYIIVQSGEDIRVLHDLNTTAAATTLTTTGGTMKTTPPATITTPPATITGSVEQQAGSVSEPVCKEPRITEVVGINECCSLTGYVVSREFKRNVNCVYDVEMQSNGKIFVPKHGRIDASELIKTNISLYPFTTSVLVIRIQQEDDREAKKNTTQIYFDSNVLPYPCLLFPGGRVKFNDVRSYDSPNGSIYYKMKENSTIEILDPPPLVFGELKELMDAVRNNHGFSVPKRDLISFVHDRYHKQQQHHQQHPQQQEQPCKNDHRCGSNFQMAIGIGKFYVTARITFIQSIIVNWTCAVCYMEIEDGGSCRIKCHGGGKKFCMNVRCVIDDGTAECYLNIDDDTALKLLTFSSVEDDLLRQATLRFGKIAYHRKSGCNQVATKPTPQASNKLESEYLLYQKSLDPACQTYYTFYCKQFKRTVQEPEYPTTIISNGITEYHSASHPKLWFQCIDFRSVDYIKMARENLHKETDVSKT